MILDTNALSAFADGEASLRRVIGNHFSLALPVIALGEYLYGINQSRFKARYEGWLRSNLPLFDLLPVGEQTARHYAEIRGELKGAGSPLPTNDVWIAALAREHGAPLLSRDRHFQAIRGLRLLTW